MPLFGGTFREAVNLLPTVTLQATLRIDWTPLAGGHLKTWRARAHSEVAMSVSQRGPAVLRPTLKRLAELEALEADWDTYGALPLTSTALARADTMIRKVVDLHGAALGERAAPYTVMPIADGGVSIEWRGAGADLELDIGPSGELSYLLIMQGDDGRQFEEGSDLPDQQALDLVRRAFGG